MNIYNPGSRYELIPVPYETDEYLFIKQRLEEVRCEGPNGVFKLESLKVYRIKDKHLLDTFDEKSNSLMLLHGTSRTSSNKIINQGFVNSEGGCFGSGVYMTDCLDVAIHYSNRKMENHSETIYVNNTNYIFFNEIVKLQTPHVSIFDAYPIYKDSEQNKTQITSFRKFMYKSSPATTSADYKSDSQGRQYRYTKIPICSLVDEYLADASLVRPRYFIELNSTVDLKTYEGLKNIVLARFK